MKNDDILKTGTMLLVEICKRLSALEARLDKLQQSPVQKEEPVVSVLPPDLPSQLLPNPEVLELDIEDDFKTVEFSREGNVINFMDYFNKKKEKEQKET